MTTRAGQHPARASWRIPAGLAAIGAVVYVNSLTGAFLFDDHPAITENPFLRRWWPIWNLFTAPTETTPAGRPLVSLTLAINHALGGLNVVGYHLINVAIHLLASLTLFGIVRRTLAFLPTWRRDPTTAAWLAGATALLWMLHPLQTQSVTYIVQRAESLMGLSVFLTLYCTIRGAFASPGTAAWHAAAIVACFAGMSSKESMVVAPLLVALYDRIFLSPSWRAAWQQRRWLYLGLAGSWLWLAVLVSTSPRPFTAGFGMQGPTPWDYALTQCGVILYYLRLTVVPAPLVQDYYDWPLTQHTLEAMPAATILMLLLAATGWALRHRPPLGFLGAWFFATLAPSSSVMPISDLIFEHRMYLPLASLMVLAVCGGWTLMQRRAHDPRRRRAIGVSLVIVVAGLFGAMTIARNADYRSEVSIWQDTARKRPRSARAHNNLGSALAAEGRLAEAMAHYREALHAEPEYADAYYNLGIAYFRQGQVEIAIRHYRKALSLRPDDAVIHNDLGVALSQRGQFDEALAHLTKALALRPRWAVVYNNIGNVLLRQDKWQEAIAQYEQALRLDPSDREAYYNLHLARAHAPR